MTRTQGNSNPTGKESPAATKRSAPKKRGVVLGLVAALLLGTAAAGIVAVRTRSRANPAEVKPLPETVLHLETFVVNLSDDDRTYLRVGIDLAVVEPEAKKGEKEGAESSGNVAEIRDTILGVLTATESTALMTSEGKQHIKEVLRNTLNTRIPELKVRDVYFTEFLIQR